MADAGRALALQRLKLAKMHLSARVLERSPRAVVARFDSLWAPMDALLERLAPLPTALVQFLGLTPRGHIVLHNGPSAYHADAQCFRDQRLEAVACISLVDLLEAPLVVGQIVGHLLDHLLGCEGLADGQWLSQGQGLSDAWTRVGERIAALYELGYGVDQASRTSPQEYFARSVAWYFQDRQRLNVADPLMERLLRRSLFDQRFCAGGLGGHLRLGPVRGGPIPLQST